MPDFKYFSLNIKWHCIHEGVKKGNILVKQNSERFSKHCWKVEIHEMEHSQHLLPALPPTCFSMFSQQLFLTSHFNCNHSFIYCQNKKLMNCDLPSTRDSPYSPQSSSNSWVFTVLKYNSEFSDKNKNPQKINSKNRV